jgi:5-methylcytosine-specific restriction endonuclease McrA
MSNKKFTFTSKNNPALVIEGRSLQRVLNNKRHLFKENIEYTSNQTTFVINKGNITLITHNSSLNISEYTEVELPENERYKCNNCNLEVIKKTTKGTQTRYFCKDNIPFALSQNLCKLCAKDRGHQETLKKREKHEELVKIYGHHYKKNKLTGKISVENYKDPKKSYSIRPEFINVGNLDYKLNERILNRLTPELPTYETRVYFFIPINGELTRLRVNLGSTRTRTILRSPVCECCKEVGTTIKITCKKDDLSGSHFNLFADSGRLMTCDHIQPRSKGGIDRITNTQTLCERCNKIKSDLVISNEELRQRAFVKN